MGIFTGFDFSETILTIYFAAKNVIRTAAEAALRL
jgi:hypothetical protein